ncbi:OsmC family protein [Flammeovirgaceae bacterium SG7u.111]|nr:OsmC family protein [Flammeovirgaceae bacterium SG7u.132]WPO35098.1 OsmC family protein [Flammeovirgaceae bacterium SG7u.111]
MSTKKFSISGKKESPTRFVASARGFRITIDQPRDFGGSDQAANPVEYLLAGYAGCLNSIGHLVALEMGFSLKSLEIDIEGSLNTDKLFGIQTEERAGYKEIEVRLKAETHVDGFVLEEWLRKVEERCPVNDTIRNHTPISVGVEKKEPVEEVAIV